jgi:hypothetical protein
MGPHFETLAREFASSAGTDLFGEAVEISEVGTTVVNDASARTQIEVDVAVAGLPKADGSRPIVSLGEAKWGETMGTRHLERLARARDLLGARGHDVSHTRLACYSGTGFDPALTALDGPDRPLLVDLPRIYRGR